MKSNRLLALLFLLSTPLCFAGELSCQSVFLNSFNGQAVVMQKFLKEQNLTVEEAQNNGLYIKFSDLLYKYHKQTEREMAKAFTSQEFVILATGQNVTFHKIDAKLSKRDFNKVVQRTADLLEKTADILPKQWMPPKLGVAVVKNFDNAYHMADNLHLPHQLKFDFWTKHPNKGRAVLVHEYGHDVFTEILGKRSRLFELFNLYAKRMELTHILQNQHQAKLDFFETKSDAFMYSDNLTPKQSAILEYIMFRVSEMETQLEARSAKIEVENEALLKKYEHEVEELNVGIYDVREITGATHEFLADVLAVLTIREKNGDFKADAIHRALFHTGSRDQETAADIKNYNRYRDFDRKMEVEGWEHDSVHVAFNPTRSYVWENYISRSKYRRHPDYLFKNIANASVNEILDRMNNPKVSFEGESYTPEELNRRLIRFIDKEFSDNPLN